MVPQNHRFCDSHVTFGKKNAEKNGSGRILMTDRPNNLFFTLMSPHVYNLSKITSFLSKRFEL